MIFEFYIATVMSQRQAQIEVFGWDENVGLLKKWTFMNSNEKDAEMVIPVNVLLEVKKNHSK